MKVHTKVPVEILKKQCLNQPEQEAEEKDKEEEDRAKAIEEYTRRARPKFYE